MFNIQGYDINLYIMKMSGRISQAFVQIRFKYVVADPKPDERASPPGKLVRIDSTPPRHIASPRGWPVTKVQTSHNSEGSRFLPNLRKENRFDLLHRGVFEILKLVFHDIGMIYHALPPGSRLFQGTQDIKKSPTFQRARALTSSGDSHSPCANV